MSKTPFVFTGVLALVLAGAFFLYQNAPSGKPSYRGGTSAESFDTGSFPGGSAPSAGSTAPNFSLKDISGNVVNSSRFAGKPTVINFFATWCPPCQEEIPGFVEVYNKYKDRGFELVGISLDTDTRGNLPAFIMNYGIGYRILLGDLATAKAYGGVSTLPTTFFIGKDGKIRNVHVGVLEPDVFDSEVRKLL